MRDIGEFIPAHKTVICDQPYDPSMLAVPPDASLQPPPPWYRRTWEVINAMADLPLALCDRHEIWECVACEAEEHAMWCRYDVRLPGETEEQRAKRMIEHDDDCPILLARKLRELNV